MVVKSRAKLTFLVNWQLVNVPAFPSYVADLQRLTLPLVPQKSHKQHINEHNCVSIKLFYKTGSGEGLALRLQFASPCLKAWAWESDSKFQLRCFFICETLNKWYNYLSLICRMKIIIVPGHTQWNTTWFRCVAGAQYVGPKQAGPSPLGWKRSGFRLSIDKTRNDGAKVKCQPFNLGQVCHLTAPKL